MYQQPVHGHLQAGQMVLGSDTPYGSVMSNHHQVEIVRMLLQETGTYNDAVVRPYEVKLQSDNIHDVIDLTLQANLRPSAAVMASIAPNVLSLVGREQGVVNIPNGWDTRRMRFMLEVRERPVGVGAGSTYYTIVQGFTNHVGASLQGSVDPNMRFFVNSFVRVQEDMMPTPNGPRLFHRVERSGQLLNGQLLQQTNANTPTLFLRPADVHGGLQVHTDANVGSFEVTDFRHLSFGGQNSVFNSHENNSAASYLNRLVLPAAMAARDAANGHGHQTPIDRAASAALANEPTINDSPFLHWLHRAHKVVNGAHFTMAELFDMDPTVGPRIQYNPISQQYAGALPARGVEATWTGGEAETIIATKLMNALPGLMWQNFIGMVSLRMNNKLGQGRVTLLADRIQEFTKLALPELKERFVHDLTEVVAKDISMNNQIGFEVGITGSIMGDINLDITIGARQSVRFVAPAFGSGVLNPVFTGDKGTFERLRDGLGFVTDGLEAVVSRARNAPRINTNI